jgi:putative PIN family toxin of toxin-antitoxin system
MRIVLDRISLLGRIRTLKGGARALLSQIADSPDHTLVISPFLLRETERVLNYPRLQSMWPLTPAEIERYTQALQDLAELVNPEDVQAIVPGDPDDDPVITTALAGRADVLCTLDRHFRHPRVLDFCGTNGIQVLTDAELLTYLRDLDRITP